MDEEKYREFARELKLLCEKHGIYIIGTCYSEGIYGKVTLVDSANPDCTGWKNPLEEIGFVVSFDKFPHLTKQASDSGKGYAVKNCRESKMTKVIGHIRNFFWLNGEYPIKVVFCPACHVPWIMRVSHCNEVKHTCWHCNDKFLVFWSGKALRVFRHMGYYNDRNTP